MFVLSSCHSSAPDPLLADIRDNLFLYPGLFSLRPATRKFSLFRVREISIIFTGQTQIHDEPFIAQQFSFATEGGCLFAFRCYV